MKIGNVSSNLEAGKVKTALTVPFGAGPKVATYLNKGTKNVTEVLKEAMPSYIKSMEKLRCLKGEAGGIIINALGTGLVAPLFIAFNPLSKADEDTKKYTAMRQPVSAVLAILIQAGLTKPLGKLYDYLIYSGKLGKSPYFDKTNLKGKDFYAAEYKKQGLSKALVSEYAGKKEAEEISKLIHNLETEGVIKFENGKVIKGNEMNQLLDKTLSGYQDTLKDKISKISQKNLDRRIARAQLLINPNNTNEINNMCETILKMPANSDTKTVLAPWLNSKNKDLAVLANEFLERGNDGAMKHRAGNTLSKINTFQAGLDCCHNISESADDLLASLSKAHKGDDAAMKEALEGLAKKYRDNPKFFLIDKFLKDLDERTTVDSKKTYIKKIMDRISDVVKHKDDNSKIIEIYQRAYYSDLTDMYKNNIEKIEALKLHKKGTITNITNNISNIKKSVKSMFGKDFSADVIGKWQKIVDGRVKGFKQITNILVGLFVTLPITCSALNWVYPRFMDIFFPSLSKNNKSEAPEEKAKLNGGKK